ncbi:succinate dehydrogenase, hydrophobic membrane anchor protein [Candidatus Sororendozoicomonas aggregata]|uniref:succinate dehydrogenase, hydrophobic membrane anchor protein n=1 Tax=Candidatus Sororendozoicomonas aggregata TaxID=3073239 RepID=UPI002ED5D144
MVTNITNFSRSGLYDWMLQRLSAVVLGVYTVFLVGYILCNPDMDYARWKGLFDHLSMKVFTLSALLSLVAHAWIGMWTITTDYFNDRAFGSRSLLIRLPIQLACFVALFCYVVWGVHILWGL